MDMVRFSIGDNHVWQGFHRQGDYSVGALVFVTADTLRALTDHFQNGIHTSAWDKIHNAPEEDWATLAFGDSGTLLSPVDGITPLYRLIFTEPTIVQRFDPTAGQTYDKHEADGTITKVPMGAWLNEDIIDGESEWSLDETTPTRIITHGFVNDAGVVGEGRSNAPLIDTARSRQERVAMEEGQEFVVDIYVPVCVSVRASKGNVDMAREMALEQLDEEAIRTRITEAIEPTSFYFSDSPYRTEVGEG